MKTLVLAVILMASTTACTVIAPPPARPTAVGFGTVVTVLPAGYQTVTVGKSRYFVHGGTYYRARGNRFVAVAAPARGRRVMVVR